MSSKFNRIFLKLEIHFVITVLPVCSKFNRIFLKQVMFVASLVTCGSCSKFNRIFLKPEKRFIIFCYVFVLNLIEYFWNQNKKRKNNKWILGSKFNRIFLKQKNPTWFDAPDKGSKFNRIFLKLELNIWVQKKLEKF